MFHRIGITFGFVRGSQPFQDLGSQIFGPGRAVLHPPRWRFNWPRWMDARLFTALALVVLSVAVGVRERQGAQPALTVAEVGQCFITPDGGAKWHSIRECRALARAARVENISIVEAGKRGQGKRRWQSPCEWCGSLLRDRPAFREKREEFEMLAGERP